MKLQLFNETDCQRIHAAAVRILGEMGVWVMDEDTRTLLKGAGCRDG